MEVVEVVEEDGKRKWWWKTANGSGGGGMKTHGKDTLRATHGGQANPNYLCVLPQLETNAMAGGSRGLNGGANFEGGVKDPNGEGGGRVDLK